MVKIPILAARYSIPNPCFPKNPSEEEKTSIRRLLWSPEWIVRIISKSTLSAGVNFKLYVKYIEIDLATYFDDTSSPPSSI